MTLVDIDHRKNDMLVDLKITIWLSKLNMDVWRWKYINGRLIAIEFDDSEDAVAFRLVFKL